jgi:hypothetical protein
MSESIMPGNVLGGATREADGTGSTFVDAGDPTTKTRQARRALQNDGRFYLLFCHSVPPGVH